jgi:trehalose 6-phosphate synthase
MTVSPRSALNDLVVVANRLPVRRVERDGVDQWASSPGGLVTALEPVIGTYSNAAWVGWAGAAGAVPPPFDHDGMRLHPVALSRGELQLYYDGFSNGTLWPLYHDVVAPPEYHRTWWDAYVTVNRRFADAAMEIAAKGATVWVHDYQLQLVPGMLRKQRPDLHIGFFLHIPFPPREIFIRLPWRAQIIEGLLGADLIGVQSPIGADNFRRAARRATGAVSVGRSLMLDGRVTAVDSFPIGIDFEFVNNLAATPEIEEKAAELRRTLSSPQTLLLGVDRLDYTKGIEARLRAYRELLEEDRLSADSCAMIQIAEPSRSNITQYADIRSDIERLAGEINGNFATMGRPAIHYLHQSQGSSDLAAMYRAADVMLVTPLRDGMNLVAKEYVASRIDNTGVLVLSEFAGAANELSQALLVNPHDIEGLKDQIEAAVKLPDEDAARRMRSMRRTVKRHDARRWATRFLEVLHES